MNRFAGRIIAAALLTLTICTLAMAEGPMGATVTHLAPVIGEEGPPWCSTSRGIFKFKEGRWQREESLGVKEVSSFAHTGYRLLAAVARQGLWASENAGIEWSKVTKGLKGRYGHPVDDINAIVVDPSSPQIIYLASGGKGFFVSTDMGRSWELRSKGLENESPAVLHPRALLPPKGKIPLLMGTDGAGLYAWIDDGWVRYGEGLPEGVKVNDLARNPADPSHIALASGFDGLWESRDGGKSFKQLWKGNFGVASAVSIGNDGTVASFLTQDGLVVVREGKPALPVKMGYMVVYDIEPRVGSGWYLGSAHDGIIVVDANGQVTGELNEGMDATTIHSFTLDKATGAVWAGDSNGAFVSDDNLNGWAHRDAGFITGPVNGFVWKGKSLFAGTGGQGVFLWDPEKVAWIFRGKAMGTSNTVYSLEITSEGRIYAGTEGGVLYTDNDGIDWTKSNEGLKLAARTVLSLDPKNPKRLWAANTTGLYQSNDGAASWIKLAEMDIELIYYANSIMWVAVHGTLYKVWKGELVKVNESTADRVLSMHAVGKRLYMGTFKGLWEVDGVSAKLKWTDAAVTSIYSIGDDVLLVGTDGRGVKKMKIK